MNKEVISEIEGIILKMKFHSLEITLAKSLIRKFKQLKEPTEKFFNSRSHPKLVAIMDITVDLQIEVDRHIKVLINLSKKLLKLHNLTTIIDAELIIPFKLKDIEKGYVKIPSSANSVITEEDYYYLLLNSGEILHESHKDLQFHLHESYSEVPKGYKLLLLLT
jgi:hypothetical protein